MFAPFLYAPRPASDYWITALPTDEVREIQKLNRWEGVWNYLWLNAPTLDRRIDPAIKWWEGCNVPTGLVCAVVQDVSMDEVLYRKIISQPHKFAEWWCRQDTTIYGVHNVLGPEWAITVLERAHDAIDRMRSKAPTPAPSPPLPGVNPPAPAPSPPT